MKLHSWTLLRISCTLSIALVNAGCVGLPRNSARTESFGLTDTGGTRLAKTFTPKAAEHPDQAGLHPMLSGVDAFAARLTLVDLAERSLDVQYYIWDPDDTGKLLAERLIAAADRGVRVRALLDDFGSVENDQRLLALDSHPNIEVRLFNPIALRGNDALGMLLDFSRTTRRMHNKSFNADNQVAIVGGRNIGDGYFEAASGLDMADFDVLAVGPVVPEVSKSFDLYWNSPAAFPIGSLSDRPAPPDAYAAGLARLTAHAEKMKETPYGKAFHQSPVADQIRTGNLTFFWGKAELMYDDPAKVAALSDDPKHRLLPRVKANTGELQKELLIVSPYFVPGDAGVEFFRTLRQRGIRVIILTNSLASTDALPAYAAYSRYRTELLSLGVELYEFKPSASYRPQRTVSSDEGGSHGLHGSSHASLHAKTFTFDRKAIFVGSLNLDPRSAHLNTEIGVLFQSPEMASEFSEGVETKLMNLAWRIEAVPATNFFGKTVKLNWVTQDGGSTIRLTTEPGQSFWRNVTTGLIQILPIESQL